MVTVEQESEIQPLYQIDSEELMENMSHASLPELKSPKSTYVDMNLGTQKDPKNIRIYSGLTPE